MSELPFYNLNDNEFVHFMLDLSNSAHDFRSILQLRNSNTDIANNLEIDPMLDHSLHINNTIYITTEELSQLQVCNSSLSVLQINCRSLKKNSLTLKIYCKISKKPHV